MIQSSQPDFRLAFEMFIPLFLLLTPDGVIKDASSEYLRTGQLQRDHVMGRKLFELLLGHSGDAHDQARSQKLRQALRQSFESAIRNKTPDAILLSNDELRPLLAPDSDLPATSRFKSWKITHSPILNPDGEITFVIHQVEGLSKSPRLEATEANKTSTSQARPVGRESDDQRFRLIAEAIPQMVWTADPDGNVDYYNSLCFSYTGLSAEKLLDDGWTLMVHPDDLDRSLKCWSEAIRSGRDFEIEQRLKHVFDGDYRWHLTRANPIRDETGKIIKWFGTATDIHDHKLLETDLARTKERLETALQGFTDGFCLIDSQWRYVFVNEYWLKYFRRKREEVIGRNFWEINPHLKGTVIETNYRRVMDEREVSRFEHLSVMAGNRWLDLRAYPSGSGMAVFCTDIHERKISQDTLRKSRDQLDVILHGVTDGIIVYDSNGRYVYANEAGARMSGFGSVEEFLSKSSPQVIEQFEMLDESGNPFPLDRLPGKLALQGVKNPPEAVIQFRFKSGGETRWSIVRGSPIFDEQGRVQLAVAMFKDMTERKRAELERERLLNEVASERARLEAVIKQLGAGVLIVEAPTGRAVFMNERVREIWGYPEIPQDAERRYVDFKGYFPDGRPLESCDWPSYRTIYKKEEVQEEEVEIVRGDGTRGFVKFSSEPIWDERGQVVAAAVTLQDVTELRRQTIAAQFLDEATHLLSSSLDYETTLKRVAELAIQKLGGWVGVNLVDENGCPQPLVVAHHDPRKVELATEFRRLYPPDPSQPGGEYEVIRSGQVIFMPEITDEMLVRGARDERHLRILRELGLKGGIITPLRSKEGVFGIINFASSERVYDARDLWIAQELSKRASLAIENAMLFKKAQEAIQIRDEFLSIASHELKTPLTPLKIQIQSLKRLLTQGDPTRLNPERIQRMAEVSDRQVSRLTNLIDDLLDVARISAGRMTLNREEFDLVELIQEVVERYSTQASAAGCEVEMDLPSKISVFWDRLRVEQVIVNLLTNAIKYAPGRPILISSETRAAEVLVQVRDHGMGIAQEHLSRIFDRFERIGSPRNVSGLGLGLFISRQIVEAHGGTVGVQSKPEQGSIFTIQLPI